MTHPLVRSRQAISLVPDTFLPWCVQAAAWFQGILLAFIAIITVIYVVAQITHKPKEDFKVIALPSGVKVSIRHGAF